MGEIMPLVGKRKEKTKGLASRKHRVLIVACLVMLVFLVSCNSNSDQTAQVPPSATISAAETPVFNGVTLLETRCRACHSADKPRKSKKTREQWEQTVTRMIGKGAQVTEAEKTVLVNYLAETYGL